LLSGVSSALSLATSAARMRADCWSAECISFHGAIDWSASALSSYAWVRPSCCESRIAASTASGVGVVSVMVLKCSLCTFGDIRFWFWCCI
jgi:hypothetical protein